MSIVWQVLVFCFFFQSYFYPIRLTIYVHGTIATMHKYVLVYTVLGTALPIFSFQEIGMSFHVYTSPQHVGQYFQYSHVYVLAVTLVNGTL